MNSSIRDLLRKELTSRGYRSTGESPHGSMVLPDEYLDDIELGELFDTLVSRREKVFKSVEVVGPEIARTSYEDVVHAIEALKVIIAKLDLPPSVED